MRIEAIALSFALAPALAFSQGGFGGLFEKAPPEVEQALRARVDHFYIAHKEGKFRKADEVVHESAKDTFFGAEKVTFREYKIVNIHWEDNYTKARVVVDIDTDFFFPGFGKMAVNRPLTSFWMNEAGQWWWYVPKFDGHDTPFGKQHPGPDGAQPADVSKIWDANAVSPDQIRKTVRPDKSEITLASHEASHAEVTIRSVFDGPVTLRLDPVDYPGVTAALDKTKLEKNEAAKLTFDFKPFATKAKKPDFRAQVFVEPLGSVIPIEVKFAYPPQ
ncbi:MAG: hypothetical protein R2729_06220 [Bryobacteraceae bacterium]